MPHQDDLKKLIEYHNRRLQILKEQQALGGFNTDPKTLIEIEEIEAKIRNLKEELEALEGNDQPDSGSAITGSAQEDTLELEPPYGTMRPDSKFYISRVADADCWESLSKNLAVTLLVQAPRQMGKSSLMVRMLDGAKKELNKRVAYIDFQRFPEQYLNEEESFLIEFCSMISEKLDIPESVERYWRMGGTNIGKCSRYLSDHIIPQVKAPFILAMDEIERMIVSPFRTNFFGMLRTWHNDRAVDENFSKVTLFLSSAIESYLLIDNPYQSPFNVAELILLEDFTLQEVENLNQFYQSPLNQTEMYKLIELIGGHPFLIRLALDLITTGRIDMKTLLDQAVDDRGPFGNHLRHNLLRISERPELEQTLIRIFQDGTCTEDRTFHQLKGLGLIKRVGNRIVPRNKLYERYFAERLNV